MKAEKKNTAELYDAVHWLWKSVGVLKETGAVKDKIIALQKEKISLLEARRAGKAEKRTAPVLQLVKK